MKIDYSVKMGVDPKTCPYLTIEKTGNITVYRMLFDSAGAIELFLSENPPVNTDIFLFQSSKMGTREFAGEPLPEAIRYCVGGYDKKLGEFLRLSRKLEAVNVQKFASKRVVSSFVGNRPNVPAYVAGAPKNMYRTALVGEKKVINVFMQVAFDTSTTEEQIRNRGILALNLISLLERNDYIVNFRLFEASYVYNEYFLCEVTLKKPGEQLEPRKCYYPMCGREFVRRVLLRIKESMPVKQNWYLSYGEVCDDFFAKKIMNVGPKDIFIGTPQQMGITGEDIYRDADAFLEALGLEKMLRAPNYRATMNEHEAKFEQEMKEKKNGSGN